MFLLISKSLRISANEIERIISDHNLHIYYNIWHYSFNHRFLLDKFVFKKNKNGSIFLYAKPLNHHSPSLVYSNTNTINHDIILPNLINGSYEPSNTTDRNIFWFLKITSYPEFLERKPKKSPFPSIRTYEKTTKLINGETVIDSFRKDYFIKYYDQLKPPAHISGDQVVTAIKMNNPNLSDNFLKTATLLHNNEIVAISLIIDDGISISADNLAAQKTNLGFGIFLLNEILKYCSENNYYSYDAGVSGIYTGYKSRLFLDSKEIISYKQYKLFKYLPFVSPYLFKFNNNSTKINA